MSTELLGERWVAASQNSSNNQPVKRVSGVPKNEQFLVQQQDAKKLLTKLLLSVPKTRLFSISLKPYRFYLFGTIIEVL
jgi:hypothetical protein